MRKALIACIAGLGLLALPAATDAAVLYGITGDGAVPSETMFTIDTTTAVATSFLGLGAGDDGEAIGFNPADGRMYHASGISNGNRFWESIDLSVPAVATSVALVGPSETTALTWNPATGTFLASDLSANFFSITTAGAATDIGGTPGLLKGLAFVGTTLYGAQRRGDILFELNPLDGASISAVTVTLAGFTVRGFAGLATDPDTGTLYGIYLPNADLTRRLAIIDPLTGVATDIGPLTSGMAGLAFGPATSVPEPSTLGFVGLGLLGLGAMRRRRRTGI